MKRILIAAILAVSALQVADVNAAGRGRSRAHKAARTETADHIIECGTKAEKIAFLQANGVTQDANGVTTANMTHAQLNALLVPFIPATTTVVPGLVTPIDSEVDEAEEATLAQKEALLERLKALKKHRVEAEAAQQVVAPKVLTVVDAGDDDMRAEETVVVAPKVVTAAQDSDVVARMQAIQRKGDKVAFLRDRAFPFVNNAMTEEALDTLIAGYEAKGSWLMVRGVEVHGQMTKQEIDNLVKQYEAQEAARILRERTANGNDRRTREEAIKAEEDMAYNAMFAEWTQRQEEIAAKDANRVIDALRGARLMRNAAKAKLSDLKSKRGAIALVQQAEQELKDAEAEVGRLEALLTYITDIASRGYAMVTDGAGKAVAIVKGLFTTAKPAAKPAAKKSVNGGTSAVVSKPKGDDADMQQ